MTTERKHEIVSILHGSGKRINRFTDTGTVREIYKRFRLMHPRSKIVKWI